MAIAAKGRVAVIGKARDPGKSTGPPSARLDFSPLALFSRIRRRVDSSLTTAKTVDNMPSR
jgi:hypothetical protein